MHACMQTNATHLPSPPITPTSTCPTPVIVKSAAATLSSSCADSSIPGTCVVPSRLWGVRAGRVYICLEWA